MSNSGKFSDGKRQGKGPEKPNFAQTCNLLSQFMKSKGRIIDLNLEAGGKVESIENLGVLAKSGLNQADFSTKQHQLVDSSTKVVEDACTSKDAAKTEPKTAQLTIFYDGKVLVFDEYPTNRARELVSLAKRGSSKMSYGILSNTFIENTSNSTSSPRQGLPPRPPMSTSEKHVGVSSNNNKEMTNTSLTKTVATSSRSEDRISSPPEDNESDMPIARRSSLYRFLEKRKDKYNNLALILSLDIGDILYFFVLYSSFDRTFCRASARVPYQLQERPEARPSSSKRDEDFDLNF